MEPWHHDDRATIYHGDCIEVLRQLPDCSVDSVVTDPPYGLGFMGKEWDKIAALASVPPSAQAPDSPLDRMQTGKGPKAVAFDGLGFQIWCQEWLAECLRVLKPGGHLLAFGGTRTWHRLACAVEDAGFEVRDSIAWLYGSGFPKSLDVSKAIDKAAGAKRTERIGVKPGHESFVGKDNLKSLRESGSQAQEGGFSRPWMHDPEKVEAAHYVTAPATPDAARWQGFGTALKPAFEPVVVARKPLTGTVAANVLEHGTGALNIDGCRIPSNDGYEKAWDKPVNVSAHGPVGNLAGPERKIVDLSANKPTGGRWPANVVLDEDQADALDQQSGYQKDGVATNRNRTHRKPSTVGYTPSHVDPLDVTYGSGGGASRFFYVAKAPARERPKVNGIAHPTVKPLTLMRWLCRLVTPPGGVVLEPFAGSGTTIQAALLEGFHVVAVEREDDYLPLIAARLERIGQEPDGQLTLDASA